MKFENLLSRIDATITPREIRVSKDLAEVVDLSSELTVEQIQEAFSEAYDDPTKDSIVDPSSPYYVPEP
ncbi:MAG: hypothetical protein QG553_231 [Patescibacteria group bacterium]|nr:hypothetical protein [Patescibacteria group bacterium]